MNGRDLSHLYREAHNQMRDIDGLLPQEAFDELLKFLFVKDSIAHREEVTGKRQGLGMENPEALRQIFSTELTIRIPWATQIWRDRQIHLTDRALSGLCRVFSGVDLRSASIDARSVALRTFLTSGIRKGLGIYLTPEEVVRAMVEITAPDATHIILDPACGSGTFLIEAVRYARSRNGTESPVAAYGIDKNPRMLLLAHLNFGNEPESRFRGTCADFLEGHSASLPPDLKPDSVDLILTNPPFGMSVTERTGTALPLFEVTTDRRKRSVPSELLFLDRCLRLLKPGGRLGIVLPRSVLTNRTLRKYRHSIDAIGRLTDLVDLPPETFVSTGTQTTTVAAFFERNEPKLQQLTMVRVCHVTNVGYDSTGRHRDGNQLLGLAAAMRMGESDEAPVVREHPKVPAGETLQRAAELLRRRALRDGAPLGDFVQDVNTGRTPSRKTYTGEGIFILKVGNLTGRGIDWLPRERNFVSHTEGAKRLRNNLLTIDKNDILLTASAHAARYIAKKVDIVNEIPKHYSHLTFVGELMRVRAAQDIDPFVLLAALRHRRIRRDIQSAVRGQTAHLNPSELLEVVLPWDLRSPEKEIIEVAHILRREADLAFRLSVVSLRAQELLESSVSAPI